MSDSTGSQPLPQRLTSYRQIRWRRAIRDTRHFIEGDIRLEVVIAATTALFSAVVRYSTGGPKELNVILFSLLVGLAVLGVVVLGHFLFYFFTAPSRIYEENQERIVKLEDELSQPLNLDIGISLIFSMDTSQSYTLRHLGEGHLEILLAGVRFTNRSKTERVSLGVTLRLRVKRFTVREVYVKAEEAKDLHEGRPSEDCLLGAIDIDPQSTKEGNMYFLIWREVVRGWGGRAAIDCSSCLIDIVDHVSGKTATKDIEQKSLATQVEQPVK